MGILTSSDVIALLRKQQGKRRQKDFAEQIGISPAYLSDVYQGRRDPGPAVLDFLKLMKCYARAK